MPGIKIENVRDNFLNFDLRDIVQLIEGEKFHWHLLFFYAFGSSEVPFNVPEFERQVASSEEGLAMEWYEIENLGLGMHQTIDCLLIGDKDKSHLRRYETEEEQNATCDIVLELIDGGFWEIHAKDPVVIKRIVRHFDGNDRFKITEIN